MTVADWTQIAGAVGTLAAVIVALFGRQLRALLVPPRLDLRLENPRGVEAGENIRDGNQCVEIPSRYFHLRVSNPRRWSPITAVRVFLIGAERRDESGNPSTWRGEVPLNWRFPNHMPPAIDIGFPRDCDLCSASEDGKLRLKQAIEWGLPGDFAICSPPVHLTLTLQARGLEADSRPLRIEIEWDGTWPADRALVIREVSRPPELDRYPG